MMHFHATIQARLGIFRTINESIYLFRKLQIDLHTVTVNTKQYTQGSLTVELIKKAK